MGRGFYDLYVSASCLSIDTLTMLRKEGFKGVGAVVSIEDISSAPDRCLATLDRAEEEGVSAGVDIVRRLAIDRQLRSSQVKKILRKWRRSFEVISVHALTRELTAFACRDGRVDVVTLIPGSRMLKGDLYYISEYGKAIELLLVFLQEGKPRNRASAIGFYRRTLLTLERKSMLKHLVFSSGAYSPSNIRDPRSMASLLHMMGIPYEDALATLSVNPASLVKKCRDKLSGRIPVRGVEVVDE